MDYSTRKLTMEQRLSVVFGGIHLDIIATELGDASELLDAPAARPGETACHWELAIENRYGVRTVWSQLFLSAEAAIDAGVKAVESEGAQTFMDMQGFEYLSQ